MTRKRDGELSDEQLHEIAGGLVATTVEYPNLAIVRKSPGLTGAGTKDGFMDYTDDC